MCLHQCVLPQHFWTEDTKSSLELLAIRVAWQGRSRHIPGTNRFRALSQQGSCSELRYILGEPIDSMHSKRFPQHLYLETNHQSFLSTKASTTITHPNHISFQILACQRKPKHPALSFWSEFPGHTVFASGYGITEQELPTSPWRLCLPIQ